MRLHAPILAALLLLGATPASADQLTLDFTKAVVHVPEKLSGPEEKAVVMLIEEVEKAAPKFVWQRIDGKSPPSGRPVIVVKRDDKPGKGDVSARGLRDLDQRMPLPSVVVSGNDPRGVLFGVGRLLRLLEMSKQQVKLPANVKIATAAALSTLRPYLNSAIGPRPIPSTAGACRSGSSITAI